ncbi:MAG: hypothetical protein AAF621_02460 [Pseudomonadota bacterium]
MTGTSSQKAALAAVAAVGKKTTGTKATKPQATASTATQTAETTAKTATASNTAQSATKPVATKATSNANAASDTNKIVSDIIQTAEQAAQKAQENLTNIQKEAQATMNNMVSQFTNIAELEAFQDGSSAVNFMLNSLENVHNRTVEIAENLQDAQHSTQANIMLMRESARDTLKDVSDAYFEAAQKSISSQSPADVISNQLECASKIRSAYSDMFSIISKASYSVLRESMALFSPYHVSSGEQLSTPCFDDDAQPAKKAVVAKSKANV